MLSLRIPPPIWLLFSAGLMWGLDRFLPLRALWGRSPLGWAIMALAVLPTLAAMRQFVRARTTVDPRDPRKTTALVTGGVYRWTRNPMYLGLLLLLVGWAVRLGSLAPLVVPALFALVITRLQILPEERALRERFGADYDRYCRATARWLGRHR